jgi:A/G-specific adenine glycosylase
LSIEKNAVEACRDGFDFSARLLTWQQAHGRHNLPWQQGIVPYKVWVSEIMLQQTQVATVLAYFERFMVRFPNVQALAAANVNEVLGLWSGLGYYTRAKNLHRSAQLVVENHGGHFPKTAVELARLPGIGASTAAAIASICFNEKISILDGNARRLLARHHGFDGDLSKAAGSKQLQALANMKVPAQADQMPRYTQALMDVGALVCTHKQPNCLACPVRSDCCAREQNRVAELPLKRKKIKRMTVNLYFLLAYRASEEAYEDSLNPQSTEIEVFLSQRPTDGIWPQLLCPRSFASEHEVLQYLTLKNFSAIQKGGCFKHALTHRDLIIHPYWVNHTNADLSADGDGRWYKRDQWSQLALPTAVKKILNADQR